MEYCCLIWGSKTKKAEQEILKIQKQAARIILDKTIKGSNSKEMFATLNWLSFTHRVFLHHAMLAHKANNNFVPPNISKYFITCKGNTQYNLRSSTMNNLYKERLHSKSTINKTIDVWNSLPQYLKQPQPVTQFKNN